MRLFPLVCLLACSGDKTDDTAACEVTIKETVPESNATGVYHRAAVEFHLSDPDPLAKVTASFGGTQSTSADGETIYFTPSSPLELNTPYTATLESCAGTTEVAFTTSGDGAPLTDPAILLNRTWSFDLAAARIVSPEGMNIVLASVPRQPLLVGVVAINGATLDLIEAGSLVDAEIQSQDYCLATTDLPGADFSEAPYFDLRAPEATVAVGGAPVTVSDLIITGTFAADGTYIAGGVLSGLLDTRTMGVLVDDPGNPAAACELMVGAGIRCGECPDGEKYCVDLLADQILAPEVSGFTISKVDGVNCQGCKDGPPAEDAVCDP